MKKRDAKRRVFLRSLQKKSSEEESKSRKFEKRDKNSKKMKNDRGNAQKIIIKTEKKKIMTKNRSMNRNSTNHKESNDQKVSKRQN